MKTRFLTSIFWIFSIILLASCQKDAEPDFLAAKQILDEKYGVDSRQSMDIYLPAGRDEKSTPLMIYIHGGGWIDGDKSEFLAFKPNLEELFPDYAFISLNYRLFDFASGRNQFPTQEEDVKTALGYIQSKLKEWKVSNNMVLAGASAGGHLALLHAYKNGNEKFRAKAVVAFIPPTDLKELHKFNNLTGLALEAILGGKPEQITPKYTSSSPITFISSSSAPTIFFHGDKDTVVPLSQSILLETVLKTSGVNHKLIQVPNQGHGFTAQTYTELLLEAKTFINGL
ncbi:alpha/beta hydrolase [Algoriphagus mannitolivorans]|uniref:alpha/beta hydrolase n=1 Tax=Algoriphagus mannitolivorans TaxID=226504 RepID=UPI00040DB809|nr:alpha/beta hydrolase [Algoriphagus mannitolivorans]